MPAGSARAAATLLLIAGIEGLAGLRALASTATASWWLGSWTCTNGGRPAALTWRVVNNPPQVAGGGQAHRPRSASRQGDEGIADISVTDGVTGLRHDCMLTV